MSNVKANIINITNKDSLQNAAEILKKGGIFVFPTDTVYGVGCALNDIAIRKLYKIKKRSLAQPTAILISRKLIPRICSSENWGLDIPHNIQKGFEKGNITLLIQQDKFEFEISGMLLKNNKIGVRIPNQEWLQKLLSIVGPIVASSANKKGEPAPKTYHEIDRAIMGEADLVIKTAQKGSGQPSTIYDLEQKIYLR